MAKEYIEKNEFFDAIRVEFYDIMPTGSEVISRLLKFPAADVRENVPVEVRCRKDCYWVRDDFGDDYTPPSSECGKDFSVFEDFNIEPCHGEHDETDCPDCPFYLNYERIVQMESEYHQGEP